jgi:1,4-dihydroxy-2-naphthoate octaprenyltransferase
MLKQSTLQLLRFPFSFFLMPVFWFALLFVKTIHWENVLQLFIIIHVLLYPASNAYNSYMDKDTESIGGVAKPLLPTKQLFYVSLIMDVLAILWAFWLSTAIGIGICIYVCFSRLYSYRGVRLKKFPIIGFLTVVLNQGGLIFFIVYSASTYESIVTVPIIGVVTSILLIGGFYPITQVYQHSTDKADDVTTISMLLGIKGTFLFCMFMYMLAFLCMAYYFISIGTAYIFIIIQLFFVPVLVYFFYWLYWVWKDSTHANFKQTMRMNWIAAIFTNVAFIFILIMKNFG